WRVVQWEVLSRGPRPPLQFPIASVEPVHGATARSLDRPADCRSLSDPLAHRRGGMGRVYLAEHVRMGRRSAVKVINPALATTADAISRFNREAANACKINHPNVAQVYDFGEMADGTLYLAMEYIDGETLDAVVA